MRHRLFHRIFATQMAFVLLGLLLTALAGHFLLADVVGSRVVKHLVGTSVDFARAFRATSGMAGELQRALERVARERGFQAALWSADGQRLAFTTTELPPPMAGATGVHVLAARGGPALAVPLSDGRVLVVQPHRVPRPLGFLLSVLALAALLALASYPAVRRLTRRLEILEAGVLRLGQGDLSARVELHGDDELTSLAGSFNHAAERLQGLVEARRRVLASASHELRSPLTRLRMALELAREDPAGAGSRLDEAVAEVEEIDSLVEELLLAGRLEVLERAPEGEPVELAALVTVEAARTGATPLVEPVTVRADARLLRVMVRNLLENARRHGGGESEVGVQPLAGADGAARLWVADRGPGVPERERERIFEPFYRPSGDPGGRHGGVGLGLALVRRIAQWYGGEVTCGPREGGGTVFEVTLRPG